MMSTVVKFKIFIVIGLILCNMKLSNSGTTSSEIPLDSLPLWHNNEFVYSGQKSTIGEERDEWDFDFDLNNNLQIDTKNHVNWIQLNDFCWIDENFEIINCSGLISKFDLPPIQSNFNSVRKGIFSKVTANQDLGVQEFFKIWPHLESLSVVESPAMTQQFLRNIWAEYAPNYDFSESNSLGIESINKSSSPSSSREKLRTSDWTEGSSWKGRNFVWHSVRYLNFSANELHSKSFPYTLMKVFPNLILLDLSKNNITTLGNIPQQSLNQLHFIDLSQNPLDCTSDDLEWVDRPNITLINLNLTFCNKPPHQNKPKPILQTIRLIKKVKSECRVNCSCVIDYIWEQDKVIHSKTAVNCSSRGFTDFPDPETLPKPTDTLYLNNNEIHSIAKFVNTYEDLGIRNLYLENNGISDLNLLETFDWIYSFQVLSLRNNNLTEVPTHMLENIMRENNWIYLIDLSLNDWKCDCRTVSTFKVWLLQYAKFIKNIEEVQCERTKNQIRYLKNEDWCSEDEVSQIIELLDLFSIFLACCIFIVITKVLYDYWNFKRNGKVPWLVSKM